jgi:hemoglobin
MSAKPDITTLEDVKLLVNTFYDKVRADGSLAPIFNNQIQDRWPQHLEKMYTFWQTLLLDEHTYFSSPFPPHAKLPVDHQHFQQWVTLFSETIRELFSGEKAEEALWRANKMAQMFEGKINYYRNVNSKLIV